MPRTCFYKFESCTHFSKDIQLISSIKIELYTHIILTVNNIFCNIQNLCKLKKIIDWVA